MRTDRINFVVMLGTALHKYGTPAHRLEQALSEVSKRLGFKSAFFSTPTSLIASFEEPDKAVPATRVVRVEPGEINLGKLSELDELGDAVVEGRVDPRDGTHLLEAILAQSPRNGRMGILVGHAIAATAVATFFKVSVADLFLSCLIGAITGLIAYFSVGSQRMSRVFETFCAFVASVILEIISRKTGIFNTHTVLITGLIVLIPGLTLTIALTELATQNLVSGTARLMGSITTFLKLILGVILGRRLVELFWDVKPFPLSKTIIYLPPDAKWIALIFTSLALALIYRARRTDVIWIFLSSAIAVATSSLGTAYVSVETGVFLGGLSVGIFSNLFARVFKRPASIPMIPGTLVLVPGTIGFKSISLLADQNILSGMSTVFSVMVLAISLVGGLFFASLVITPKRSL